MTTRSPKRNSKGCSTSRLPGVVQDDVYAHLWRNIATSQGHESAAKYRDSIAKEMTPADISAAQKLARESVKKNYKDC